MVKSLVSSLAFTLVLLGPSANAGFQYNHIQCFFQEFEGIGWQEIISSYIDGGIEVVPGQVWPLKHLWWKVEVANAEISQCSHVSDVRDDGKMLVRAVIQQAKEFEDLDTFTCDWSGKSVRQMFEVSHYLGYGDHFSYVMEFPYPARALIKVFEYIPTPREMSRLDPDKVTDICERFTPE